ncbi:heavy metal-associated isoprenylated plant protein 32-like [Zingiber officinale]|uniref:heavy metal-associated isoprenylated plant protein 32-like n=1 Tax=Zingiber officinale TaxID=94328 RepID=UPI001C4B1CB5|nr:heavy metal-associated isoprenylated plant protein 32-like [Zingiber officinale]
MVSKEEDSLKFLKTQACVMRVNICCNGCQKKVKKVLHKIDGVYTVSINVEGRKLTVVGNVSPDILIKKLNKAGKHAELLSAKAGGGGGDGGGKGQSLTSQLQKLQLEHGKAQKDGGGGGGGKEQKGPPVPQTQLQEGKGIKDLKFLSFKDLKIPFKKDNHKAAAKLDLPSKEEFDDGSDFDDDEDDYDEFDDDEEDLDDMDEYSDEEPYEKPKMMMKPSNLQPKGSGVVAKDKKGGSGDKGGEGSKKGNGGEGAHDKKNGGRNNNNIKGGNSNNNGGNHTHSGKSPSNKGGGSNNSMGGGLPIGQPHMMGQFGNMQSPMGLMATNNAQGLPAGTYFPPEMMTGSNPYQQQYLQWLMQQQRMMTMSGQDRPTGYGYGPPPMYGPQQNSYSMFSDENLNGCSIM